MDKMTTYKGLELSQKRGNLEAYIPSNELKNAVNLTLYLKKRPLLLMGEPGCGKTRLAEAVAYELHKEAYKYHFFEWHIKSTSKAKEGIYEIDYLQRLQDANVKDGLKDLRIKNYIQYGAMYKAFTTENRIDDNGIKIPNVLLIDEIDKADIDFPNDLLLELDRRKFYIPELKKKGEIEAKSEVIVFITSNEEKELPPAFLRRCLYHYIKFPELSELEAIIKAKFAFTTNHELVGKAVAEFGKVREKIEGMNKKPSTSELLDWFEIIYQCVKLSEIEGQLSNEQKSLLDEFALLGTDNIPFKQMLLKNKDSFHNLIIGKNETE